MVLLVLLGTAFASLLNPQEDLDKVIQKSIELDRYNEVTCKRPSVKEFVHLWNNLNHKCLETDQNDFVYVSYKAHLNATRQAIKQEVNFVWSNYKKHAWGSDTILPVSGKPFDAFGSISYMIHSSLDSLFLMGNLTDFKEALEYSVTTGKEIHTSEYIQDLVGGLLSAYFLSGEPLALEKAKQAGELLWKIYTYRRELLPYPFFNLKTGQGTVPDKIVKSSELLNLSELLVLYKLTNSQNYQRVINSLENLIQEKSKDLSFLPISFFTREFKRMQPRFGGSFILNSQGAHLHRYLFNNWLLSGHSYFKELYDRTKWKVIDLALTNQEGKLFIPVVTERGDTRHELHQASCAWAGQLALENLLKDYNSTEVGFAKKLMETCLEMFSEKELPSSTFKFSKESTEPLPGGFELHSEVFEGLFHLYRLTGDQRYRKVSMSIFEKVKAQCKAQYGYSTLDQEGKQTDTMPSSFLSKTLKYLYLLHSSETFLKEAKYLFTPRGHIFKYIS